MKWHRSGGFVRRRTDSGILERSGSEWGGRVEDEVKESRSRRVRCLGAAVLVG